MELYKVSITPGVVFEVPRNESVDSVGFLAGRLAVFCVFQISADGDPEVFLLLHCL